MKFMARFAHVVSQLIPPAGNSGSGNLQSKYSFPSGQAWTSNVSMENMALTCIHFTNLYTKFIDQIIAIIKGCSHSVSLELMSLSMLLSRVCSVTKISKSCFELEPLGHLPWHVNKQLVDKYFKYKNRAC